MSPVDRNDTRMSSRGSDARPNLFRFLLFAALVSAAAPAAAHDGTGLAGGFLAGLLHPLTGFDHALAMVAVGLWGAFLGRPLVVALPIIFPMMMTFGAAIGMAALPMPSVEAGIALSVLVLGLVILFAWRAPIALACAIVGAFALFHGYAHGTELPAAADPFGYSAGFVLSTGLLHVAGIALGVLSTVPGGPLALRATGGIIAAIGILFVGRAIA